MRRFPIVDVKVNATVPASFLIAAQRLKYEFFAYTPLQGCTQSAYVKVRMMYVAKYVHQTRFTAFLIFFQR